MRVSSGLAATVVHYAVNECAMPIRLHCNELRALRLTTNSLGRTAEFGALLLKCVLIVYIWLEKGVVICYINLSSYLSLVFIDTFEYCLL